MSDETIILLVIGAAALGVVLGCHTRMERRAGAARAVAGSRPAPAPAMTVAGAEVAPHVHAGGSCGCGGVN